MFDGPVSSDFSFFSLYSLLEKRAFHSSGFFVAGWSSPVARQAHNLKVAGSNPAPAPNDGPRISKSRAIAISKVSNQTCSLPVSQGKLYQVYVLRNVTGRFYIGSK